MRQFGKRRGNANAPAPAHRAIACGYIEHVLPKFTSNNRTTGTPEENAILPFTTAAYCAGFACPLQSRCRKSFSNWIGSRQERSRSLEMTGGSPAQVRSSARLVASVAWPTATLVAKRTQRLHGVWD